MSTTKQKQRKVLGSGWGGMEILNLMGEGEEKINK
jgi:hypothetical protein